VDFLRLWGYVLTTATTLDLIQNSFFIASCFYGAAFGAVLVKDSFTVTDDGEIFAGALFVMEKLSPEAYPDTGDWRYQMIMPDGSIFGDTTGEAPQNMEFCHTCHQSVADSDYLFLIPEDYRAKMQ